jgi:hypothetical protein
MSAIQSWVKRDDAKRAEELKEKSTRWFALRVALGIVILIKAAHFALTATGVLGYVLAVLFTIAGLAWLVEGVQGLRSRLLVRKV